MIEGTLQPQAEPRLPRPPSSTFAAQPPREEGSSADLTVRSVLLGALMCVVIGILDPTWTFFLHTSNLFFDYSVGGAMFFLFLLVLLINGALGMVWRRAALRSGEMVIVTVMMFVAGAIATLGLTGNLVPNMASPYYLATPENEWKQKLWPRLPQWTAPLDLAEPGTPTDKRTAAIMEFYNGIEDKSDIVTASWWTAKGLKKSAQNFGRITASMPWKPWIKPLAFWGIFLMALYGALVSIMTIIRKQWIEYERLTFPIAQVPLELCATAASPWGRGSILRSPLFWIGFGVPFVMGTLQALQKFYPRLPTIPTAAAITSIGPIPLDLYLSWVVLGFTFLIPNEVAFSVWFLNILSFIFRSILMKYGFNMDANLGLYGAARYPVMAYQGMGAMLVFTLGSLYFTRQHLKKVLLCAVGPKRAMALIYCLASAICVIVVFALARLTLDPLMAALVAMLPWGLLTLFLSRILPASAGGAHTGERAYDENEPSSYRTALVILLVAVVIMIAWLYKAGLHPLYGCVFVAAAMLIYYGVTRVVAQCGVSVTTCPMIAPAFMTTTFGGANISAPGIGALSQSWSWVSDIRTSVMASAAHGMYLARRKTRALFAPMLLAALITFVVATLATIWLGYRVGAANMHAWFFIDGPKRTFDWGLREIVAAKQPLPAAFSWMAVGAAIMTVLLVAHRALYWWPIHPVGFIICSIWWTDVLWLTIFLAWLMKLIVVQVGGNRLLRKARRFFLGMILGQFSVAGVWAIYDTLTGTVGHGILWI